MSIKQGGCSIVVVKKTFRYPNVFFYNRKFIFYNLLCPNPLFRNINMEKGIIGFFSKELPKAGFYLI